MKNYILTVILAFTSLILQSQTSTGKHHIKYLDINTGNSDYGVDFIDNNKVVFAAATSERVSNSSKYQAHLDLFEGEVGEEGEIINKSRNNGIISKRITKTGATFTSDKKTVYFTAKKYVKRKSRNPVKSEIFKADINESGVWTNIEKLSINKRNYSIENPTLNKEENRVYFSSDLPSTLGGKDIFVSDINEDGTLGEPKNLGDKVNTQKDEITPFIADNNFLYFSSNGREDSIGNFDIYTSEAFENTVSIPLHLDSPINSINDDFAYIVNSDKGYFSSNRLQGQKNNDIYSFYIEPDKPIVCLQEIVGTVRDKETESLLSEAIIIVIDDKGEEVKTLTTDEKGNYRFSLDCRNTFTIRATKPQYSEEEHIVNTANYLSAPPLEVNQGLAKDLISTENNKVSIKVNPIYFGFDKSNLNSEAKLELDKIVKVMKENSTVIVEAASHTDSRGSAAYNQKLSERRSQSSVDYIISKGIDQSRIISKGYGESQLLNNCSNGVRCTNDQHHFNRRTEFIIINKQVLNKPKPPLSTGKIVSITEVDPVINEILNKDSQLETGILDETNSYTEKKNETNQTDNILEKSNAADTINKVNAQNNEEENNIDSGNNSTKESIEQNKLINSKSNDDDIEVKNKTSQVDDILEKSNLGDNTSKVKTKENKEANNIISGDNSAKESIATNKLINSDSNDDNVVKNKTSDQNEVEDTSEVNETESKFSENNIISVIGFREPEPDKEKKIYETTITNTNISIVDNHEIALKNDLRSEIDNDMMEIVNTKPIILFKDKNLNKEEVAVTTEPSSSSFNETTEMKILNSNTEKNLGELQIRKEPNGILPEENTEIMPNDYIEIISSNENEVSLIERDKPTSTINKKLSSQNKNITTTAKNLFNQDEEDIEANANNFSRDFTNDIVITDYKKTAKPEKKATEVIIKEQKERFKKDYVSSTRTIKKEEVLMINSIDVSPISIKNNGKYIETTKSNKVDVMRINFQIDNNKYITSGYKEVFILIQNPAGTILNRKGTFEMKNGQELTYTEKTNAYYNNHHLNISMVTDRFIQRIIKGVYTITIYIEGYPVGLEMLELS